MTVYRHDATYQGVPTQAVSFRRSAGLSPEFGHVDMMLEDLKSLKIVLGTRAVLWRAVNWNGGKGIEYNGQQDMYAWAQQHKNYGEMTIDAHLSTAPKVAAPADGGLGPFGELILTSKLEAASGSQTRTMTYTDIYVASSGVEELTHDIADQLPHNKGKVRVPITDVRWFYQRYGSIVCRINVRNERTGRFDERTTKEKQTPWPADMVFRYLASSLPGSPAIVDPYGVLKETEPPTNVIAEGGELAVQLYAEALSIAGLQVTLLPNNNHLISRKAYTALKPGDVPEGVKQAVKGYDTYDLSNERKTVYYNDKPEMVQVFGKRRVRRMWLPCTPVAQDLDGRWYQLFDLVRMWGYSWQKVRRGATMDPAKAFQDVPPTFGSSQGGVSGASQSQLAAQANAPGNISLQLGIQVNAGAVAAAGGKLHDRRRQILLRQAFKCYAPIVLFVLTPEERAAGLKVKSLADRDFEAVPWLPMVDAPVYKSEMKSLHIDHPRDTQPEAGDVEDFFVIPPIVRARRFGQGWFTDFAAVKAKFNQMISENNSSFTSAHYKELADLEDRLRDYFRSLRRAEVVAPTTYDGAKATAQGAKEGLTEEHIQINADLMLAARDVGVPFSTSQLSLGSNTQLLPQIVRRAEITAKYAQGLLAMLQSNAIANIKLRARLKEWEKVYQKHRGLQLMMNLAHGVIPHGDYELDARTGIITFGEVTGWMSEPFIFDGDTAELMMDGAVGIQFGYELQDGATSDYTSVIFSSEKFDLKPTDTPRAWVAGYHRASPIKAWPERASQMRAYEEDLGTPMNLTSITTQAAARAVGLLKRPRVVEGFVDEWIGVVKCVLDAGVESIQHIWDGDVMHTHIAVNAPYARLPMGPPALARQTEPITIMIRDAMEQHGETVY